MSGDDKPVWIGLWRTVPLDVVDPPQETFIRIVWDRGQLAAVLQLLERVPLNILARTDLDPPGTILEASDVFRCTFMDAGTTITLEVSALDADTLTGTARYDVDRADGEPHVRIQPIRLVRETRRIPYAGT